MAGSNHRVWPSRALRPSRVSGLARSLPSSSSGSSQISVRGTFLQVVQTEPEDLEPSSPTSLSDPGSEASSNSRPVSLHEQQSVEILNKRMADWWRRPRSDFASELDQQLSNQSVQPVPDQLAAHTERDQQLANQSVELAADQEALPQLLGVSGPFLGQTSAAGSTTSISSLSTWQGLSEDLHETVLRHQLESPDQPHQTSAIVVDQPLHQSEQTQYPLGCFTRRNQPSEEHQAHQLAALGQGSANDSSSCLRHASHHSWQPSLPHVNWLNELVPGTPQNTRCLVPNAGNIDATPMPWMGAVVTAQIPQTITGIDPATQCLDAVSTLSEIPEQVRQLLESTTYGFAEHVQGEVTAMGNVIQNSSDLKRATEVAVEKLECIPGLIIDSFEGKMMRIKDRVRRKVNNVIDDLDHTLHFREEVVQKLYTIPEEVMNITTEALEEVYQDSQIISAQQIDNALLSVPMACVEEKSTLNDMRSSIVASVPDAPFQAVHDAATEAVEQAVAQICETLACPANELVADQLLRIKAAGNQGASAPSGSLGVTVPGELHDTAHAIEGASSDAGMILSAAGNVTQPRNPGSLGHPELCPRPCLYFARGECVNKDSCDFCHLPHPKRPSHLDKRHREVLKQMPLSEAVSVAMPVLREKALLLSLGNSVMELLDELEDVANRSLVNGEHVAASSSRPSSKRSGRSRNLQGAMRGITLRSLLTALHRSGMPGDASSRAALANLLRSLRSVAPDFPCDVNSEHADLQNDVVKDD